MLTTPTFRRYLPADAVNGAGSDKVGTSRQMSVEPQFGFLFRAVANVASQALREHLANTGISASDWQILKQLALSGAERPNVVAERIGRTAGAITKSLEKLIAADLLVMLPDSNDRRCRMLKLTANGRDVIQQLDDVVSSCDRKLFAPLNDSEQKALTLAITKLYQAV